MSSDMTVQIPMLAPEADDAVECEFQTHELQTWMGRYYLSFAHPETGEEGYDPYNSAPLPQPQQMTLENVPDQPAHHPV